VSEAWLHAVAASPWLYPVLYLLVVGDAFLVVLPSETFVVALGVLSAATGQPPLWAVIPVAALGAITGDLLCFRIGRSVGLERWRWQRRPRVARAIERARTGVHRRPAALILTARYIPFARIAVNLAAGATGLPGRVFLPLAAVAGTAWAVYNSMIGAVVGRLVPNPVIAVIVSVAIALVVGATVDAIGARINRVTSKRTEPSEP
jgi:membrane-associated protein